MAEDAKTKPLMTKTALIERIDHAFEKLMAAVEGQSDEAMIERRGPETWSWKDTLAHIAAWEQILVRFHMGGEDLEQVIGFPGVVYGVTSFDEINAHLNARDRHLSPEESLAFLRRTHEQVMRAIHEFPEADLHQAHPHLNKDAAVLVTWIDYIAANTFEHYEEHMAVVRD